VQVPSSATTSDIVALTVAPSNPTVSGTGQTESFIATGTTGTGSTEDVTNTAVWTSSNQAVATIGAKTGLATTVGAGSTFIVATYTNADGLQVTANTQLTVQ
jgi:trimeric autotransporter adhesin